MKIQFEKIDQHLLEWPVLLFDFDGTLVHSEGHAQEAVRDYFAEKGLTPQVDFSKAIIGRTWRAAAETAHFEAKRLGIALPSPDEMVQDWRRRYREKYDLGVPLIPGVRETLVELSKHAEFLGIVTGSDRDEVERILDQHSLGSYFKRIWAAGEYQSSKPHPAPYLKALNDLNAPQHKVLVFEDSLAGMESAHQAKLPWIQIQAATQLEADPRALKAIQDYREFNLEWIKRKS